MIQDLLGVKARRAQQITASCVSRIVGTSALIDRESFIRELKRIQTGEAASYEQKRRQRVARVIQELSCAPVLKVEAPATVVNQVFENLPSGVDLAQGRITIRFADPKEALEKLLALAMAVGNDCERFESMISTSAQ
jgi:hypothetical protein